MKQVLLANQCYDFALGFSLKRCELLFAETRARLTYEIWSISAGTVAHRDDKKLGKSELCSFNV